MIKRLIPDAILELAPGAEFAYVNNQVVWLSEDISQPSWEDIIQKVAELEYKEEVQEYQKQRESAYPDWGTQLDYIYHNGVDAWKSDIVDPVKAQYPKQTVDNTTLEERKAQALFDHQLEEYKKAQARLAKYQVALGREEVTEEVVIDQDYNSETEETVDITETRVVQTAIDPVEATVERTIINDETKEETTDTIENPLITKDNEERAAAQAIVDATPQEVVDAYNAL